MVESLCGLSCVLLIYGFFAGIKYLLTLPRGLHRAGFCTAHRIGDALGRDGDPKVKKRLRWLLDPDNKEWLQEEFVDAACSQLSPRDQGLSWYQWRSLRLLRKARATVPMLLRERGLKTLLARARRDFQTSLEENRKDDKTVIFGSAAWLERWLLDLLLEEMRADTELPEFDPNGPLTGLDDARAPCALCEQMGCLLVGRSHGRPPPPPPVAATPTPLGCIWGDCPCCSMLATPGHCGGCSSDGISSTRTPRRAACFSASACWAIRRIRCFLSFLF